MSRGGRRLRVAARGREMSAEAENERRNRLVLGVVCSSLQRNTQICTIFYNFNRLHTKFIASLASQLHVQRDACIVHVATSNANIY